MAQEQHSGLKIRVSVVRFRPWPPSARVLSELVLDGVYAGTSNTTSDFPV